MRKALNVSSIALVFAGANLLAGCAFTGRGGIQNKTSAITQEEMEMSGLVFTDAYDVVRQFPAALGSSSAVLRNSVLAREGAPIHYWTISPSTKIAR